MVTFVDAWQLLSCITSRFCNEGLKYALLTFLVVFVCRRRIAFYIVHLAGYACVYVYFFGGKSISLFENAAEGLAFGNSCYWIRFDEEHSDKVLHLSNLMLRFIYKCIVQVLLACF